MPAKITTIKTNTKDIWDPEEVAVGGEYDDVDDPREQPQYGLFFRTF